MIFPKIKNFTIFRQPTTYSLWPATPQISNDNESCVTVDDNFPVKNSSNQFKSKFRRVDERVSLKVDQRPVKRLSNASESRTSLQMSSCLNET